MARKVCPHCATTKTPRWRIHNGIMYCNRCALALTQRGYLPELDDDQVSIATAGHDLPIAANLQDGPLGPPPVGGAVTGVRERGGQLGAGMGAVPVARANSVAGVRDERGAAMTWRVDRDGTRAIGSSSGVALERNGGRHNMAARGESDVVFGSGGKRRIVNGGELREGRDVAPFFGAARPLDNAFQRQRGGHNSVQGISLRHGRMNMANIANGGQVGESASGPSGRITSNFDAGVPPLPPSNFPGSRGRQADPLLGEPLRAVGRRKATIVQRSRVQQSVPERESFHQGQPQERRRCAGRGGITHQQMENPGRRGKRFDSNGRQIAATWFDSPHFVRGRGGKVIMQRSCEEGARPRGMALSPEEVVIAVRAAISGGNVWGYFSEDGRSASGDEGGDAANGRFVDGVKGGSHRVAPGVYDAGAKRHLNSQRRARYDDEEMRRVGDSDLYEARDHSAVVRTISRCAPPFFVTDDGTLPTSRVKVSTAMEQSSSPGAAAGDERNVNRTERGDLEALSPAERSRSMSLTESMMNSDDNEDSEDDDSMELVGAWRIADRRAKSLMRHGYRNMHNSEEDSQKKKDGSSANISAVVSATADPPQTEIRNLRAVICAEIADRRKISNDNGGITEGAVSTLVDNKNITGIEGIHNSESRTVNDDNDNDEIMKGNDEDINEDADEICKVDDDNRGKPRGRVAKRVRFREDFGLPKGEGERGGDKDTAARTSPGDGGDGAWKGSSNNLVSREVYEAAIARVRQAYFPERKAEQSEYVVAGEGEDEKKVLYARVRFVDHERLEALFERKVAEEKRSWRAAGGGRVDRGVGRQRRRTGGRRGAARGRGGRGTGRDSMRVEDVAVGSLQVATENGHGNREVGVRTGVDDDDGMGSDDDMDDSDREDGMQIVSTGNEGSVAEVVSAAGCISKK